MGTKKKRFTLKYVMLQDLNSSLGPGPRCSMLSDLTGTFTLI